MPGSGCPLRGRAPGDKQVLSMSLLMHLACPQEQAPHFMGNSGTKTEQVGWNPLYLGIRACHLLIPRISASVDADTTNFKDRQR